MSNQETTRLADKIGVPATLEMMAEECAELQKVCLKYARYLRNENPTVGYDKFKLKKMLAEEMADVYVTLNEVRKAEPSLVDKMEVADIIDFKRRRMYERLGVKADSFIF